MTQHGYWWNLGNHPQKMRNMLSHSELYYLLSFQNFRRKKYVFHTENRICVANPFFLFKMVVPPLQDRQPTSPGPENDERTDCEFAHVYALLN